MRAALGVNFTVTRTFLFTIFISESDISSHKKGHMVGSRVLPLFLEGRKYGASNMCSASKVKFSGPLCEICAVHARRVVYSVLNRDFSVIIDSPYR